MDRILDVANEVSKFYRAAAKIEHLVNGGVR